MDAEKINVNGVIVDLKVPEGSITTEKIADKAITKSKLSDEVQESLDKADTAIQEHQSLAEYRKAAAQDEIDNGKVDKVAGKGLSTNDFSNEEKAKLADLENYDDTEVKEDIAEIEGKIPSQATSTNQLADKEFVNSSVTTNTAFFRGTWDLVENLGLTKDATEAQIAAALATAITEVTNNDYSFVFYQDPTTGVAEYYDRYKYSTEDGWGFEYRLNNSSFTAAQWAAIQSGITSGLVAKLSALPTAEELAAALLAKYEKPTSGIPETDLSEGVKAKLNLKEIVYGYLNGGLFYKDIAHTTVIPAELDKQYTDITDSENPVPYIWNGSEYRPISGGGGSAGIVLSDIDDDLAGVLLRWPLLKDGVVATITSYPNLKNGLVSHSELAPYYAEAKAIIDENEGLEDNIAAYPIIAKLVVENEGLAPIIVDNEGLDALVAANPAAAPAIASYPAIAPYCVTYPSIVKSIARWNTLVPVLLSEPRYIPYLAEDAIIAHSLVETGQRAWLIGDGVAYINTGLYQLEWPLKIKTHVAYNTTSEMYLGGNYTGSNNGSRVGIASSKHTMYSGSNYQPISTAITARQEYAVEFEYAAITGKKMTVDGVVNENASVANKVGANNIPFGWFSCKGNAATNVLNGRLPDADLTIGENTYHYIPAMHEGEYGYLETTTMEFKGNNNTSGKFLVATTPKTTE